MWIRQVRAGLVTLLIAIACSPGVWAQSEHRFAVRGHEQLLRLYGPAAGDPVIVSSGDGGWIHLGPHVAELLASRGLFVVGFDVKAYLSSFTTDAATLRTSDEPGDYKALAAFASAATGHKTILIGVSEGAGLSVLAATDPETKALVSGVIGLGLPDLNELGWRWKDSLIYLTHRAPKEPMFSAAEMIRAIAPVPLAIIQSTHDEFVPIAETQRVFARAAEPKRLWVVDADNHRFSSNLSEFDARLMEAIEWVQRNQPQ